MAHSVKFKHIFGYSKLYSFQLLYAVLKVTKVILLWLLILLSILDLFTFLQETQVGRHLPESHWGWSADFVDSYITSYLQILTSCPISQGDARYIEETLKVNLEIYPDICYLITDCKWKGHVLENSLIHWLFLVLFLEIESGFCYTHTVGRTWI